LSTKNKTTFGLPVYAMVSFIFSVVLAVCVTVRAGLGDAN
jgi:hypothetical protein